MAEKVSAAELDRAVRIYERLHEQYPDAGVTLDHKNPLQLLVATIMAAQCTDARVNIVTKKLFKKYKKCRDYLAVPREELAKDVMQCGFFNQKAASIQKSCEIIMREHGGKVPGTMEDLVKLPGVGRKTANVILGVCFDTPGIIVDTHVRRVSARLGLTKHTEPDKIEQDLMRVVPRENWTQFSHLLVFHGRSICVARKPKCPECPVYDLCPYPKKTR
jgi:endonuclease III